MHEKIIEVYNAKFDRGNVKIDDAKAPLALLSLVETSLLESMMKFNAKKAGLNPDNLEEKEVIDKTGAGEKQIKDKIKEMKEIFKKN